MLLSLLSLLLSLSPAAAPLSRMCSPSTSTAVWHRESSWCAPQRVQCQRFGAQSPHGCLRLEFDPDQLLQLCRLPSPRLCLATPSLELESPRLRLGTPSMELEAVRLCLDPCGPSTK